MTSIRKEFFKRVAYVGLGVIPIIFLWDEKGPERFIGVAAFLFGMYHLIMIIGMMQVIIDEFFPPRTRHELKNKPFDKFVYYFAGTLFFAGLLFEIFEIRRIDNTLGGTGFFWTYALIGVLIATTVTLILKFVRPSIYFESSRRLVVYIGFFFGGFLLVPATASFINHYFSDEKIYCTEYKVVRKSTGGRRVKSSWLFLQIGKNEERFGVTRDFWDRVNEGEFVILCTQNGRLGYDFVSKFKRVNP